MPKERSRVFTARFKSFKTFKLRVKVQGFVSRCARVSVWSEANEVFEWLLYLAPFIPLRFK
jgi:hypothetical protein